MFSKLKNLFKIARLLSTNDSADLRFARITGMGKEQKILLFTPYGLMSHPPDGSMVTVFNQLGHESNGVGVADDPANRIFRNLSEGEIAVGNYLTGAYIIFKSDGSIEIDTPGDIRITSATLTHNGINIGDDHVHDGSPSAPSGGVSDTGGPK